MNTMKIYIKRIAIEAGFDYFDDFPDDYQAKIERLVELAHACER